MKAHAKPGVALLVLTITALTSTRGAAGYELLFPSASAADYWVACGWNAVAWSASSSNDSASLVTLMLANADKSVLNAEFEIANAVPAHNATALSSTPTPASADTDTDKDTDTTASNNTTTKTPDVVSTLVYVPCVKPTTGYTLLFVNATHYDHSESSDVFYTSPSFEIKPRGTTPATSSGQTAVPLEFNPEAESPGIVIPAAAAAAASAANSSSAGDGDDILKQPPPRRPRPPFNASDPIYDHTHPNSALPSMGRAAVDGSFAAALAITVFAAAGVGFVF
ncbi:hypothetical protein BCV70DRAFT_114376 [Testicularia cyperi]|uniref:Uncharacterized protein n=1 Tax=Testicularia cyperi TaxID=1882483 RepID=A0A317XPT5_9BASI|nr:hypothetical protein BCV70DRAFT_114376 [Testicularia cyperi]